jgi:hypothetical protein
LSANDFYEILLDFERRYPLYFRAMKADFSPSAERRAPSAERRAPSAERRAPSAGLLSRSGRTRPS